MIDIKNALREAFTILENSSPSPQLDAEILLAHSLKKLRAYLYTYPEEQLSHAEWESFYALLMQRNAGHPIAYLTGSREFWSMTFQVDNSTLIPRPETELLVEIALLLLPRTKPINILELGTGCGAISLALATECPDWQIFSCDINPQAVAIARSNVQHYQINNVHCFNSNWFSEVPQQKYHAIIANPPYLAQDDEHLNQGDVRFEPQQALISGASGLESLEHIIEGSHEYLLPSGLLLLEHGFMQKTAVKNLLIRQAYQNIQCWSDYQGNDRVCGGWVDKHANV